MNQAPGIELLRRYNDGEQLTQAELESLEAAVYLIQQTWEPPRSWNDMHPMGLETFMDQVWPQVRERLELSSGLFEHGSVKP